jgi:Na+/H+-dicarboxylate symporter
MTTLLMASLLLAGFFGYRQLPIAAIPRIDVPTITVTTQYPGASPDTMAVSIAAPLERQFATIAGVTAITSLNTEGNSQITLEFDLSRNIDAAALDTQSVANYAAAAHHGDGVTGFLLGIIPDSFLGALTGGAMLQVILIALLAGFALSGMRERAARLTDLIDDATQMMFRVVAIIMWFAPIGAGAGIAFTIGTYGIGSLAALGKLMIALSVTAALFVFVVLGLVMRLAGLRLWPLLRFIRDEIVVTFGTCSTEAVLPQVMRKMEIAGVEQSAVGLVMPTGYTFNTDGTSIYLTMAVIFIAQATNIHLSLGDQLTILFVLLLTSKGSAGVAGAGFVALAATIQTIPALPVAGLVLLVGIDRFLTVARAVTNLIGNCVATLVVARWDGALDMERARLVLEHGETEE